MEDDEKDRDKEEEEKDKEGVRWRTWRMTRARRRVTTRQVQGIG